MYCRSCFADLAGATDGRCPKCNRAFDLAKPRTYLARPFPTRGMIALHVIVTTLIAIVCAFAVAFHQLARSSGH